MISFLLVLLEYIKVDLHQDPTTEDCPPWWKDRKYMWQGHGHQYPAFMRTHSCMNLFTVRKRKSLLDPLEN
jgi:hypothetical protein